MLEDRRDCISGYNRSETIEETVVGRLPSPVHCRDSTLKHILSLLVKKADLLALELPPEGQDSGFVARVVLQKCCQETQTKEYHLCALPMPRYRLPLSPRKELTHYKTYEK